MKTPKLDALPQKYRDFVLAYFTNGFNITKAARTAGAAPRRAQQTGSDWFARKDVQEAIAERHERTRAIADITIKEVVTELTGFLRANILDYTQRTAEGIPYVDLRKVTPEQAKSINELTSETIGGDDSRLILKTRVKLNDKLNAADKLLRHLGGYKDQLAVVELSHEDWLRRLAGDE